MDEDSIKLHIENIKELVLDEEKLITYCWLSKKLCIHVNAAKVLLENFIGEHRKKCANIPLQVSYMVSGTQNDGAMFIKVVPEDEYKLMNEKLSFSHVYSVRKGQAKLDLNSFNLLNDLENFDNYIGLIQNELTAKISENEIDKLKQSSYAIIDKAPIKVENKASGKIKLESSNVKTEDKSKNDVPLDKNKDKSSVNNGANNKQAKVKGNIQSMFSTQNAKPAAHEPKSDNKKSVQPKSNEITGFFKKQPNNTSKATNGKKNTLTDVIKENVNGIKELIESPVHNKSIKIEPESPKPEKSKRKKIEETKNKKSDKIISNVRKKGKVDKKRKRVLQVSDSEDSAEENDPFEDKSMEQQIESDEDIIPPTPPLLTKVKMVSNAVNPKKRRKIVDKTYTDEEGYILTRKEEVYESCSDEEKSPQKENVIKKEEPEDNSPVKKFIVKETKAEKNKKQSPAAKGKQQTLTSFFTKKT